MSRYRYMVVCGLLVAGTVSGCGGEVRVPVPNVSTAATQAQTAGAQALDKLRDDLNKVIDPNASPKQQFDQLLAKGKELYCKAENSVVAEAIKQWVVALRNQIANAHPDAGIPPVSFDSKTCG